MIMTERLCELCDVTMTYCPDHTYAYCPECDGGCPFCLDGQDEDIG